ncbi:alpha/beta fold hydrolase [Streptomyces sp. NPDC059256]|uniref:alpha/beta fold hydrolase n=1 Tax=Streptomyces sp. NPDC059256 TaxID=3346794 RepID=UPI003677AE88
MATSARLIEANGQELSTEFFGNPDDPAVLLLHGAGHSLVNWPDDFVERLATGGRYVIRYDSRDAGRSTTYPVGAPPYDLRDLVADAAALIEALGPAPVHVVGMSQGAAIGQLLALDHPGRVATLILASSTPGGPGHDHPDLPPMSERLAAFFTQADEQVDWSDRTAAVEALVEGERPFAAESRPFDAEGVRLLAVRTVDRSHDIAAQSTNPYLLDAGQPWRHRLGRIAAPTLVLHGAEDPLFPIEHGVALAAEIPNAHFIPLAGTGHEVFPREEWDTVVPALLAHTAGSGE